MNVMVELKRMNYMTCINQQAGESAILFNPIAVVARVAIVIVG
jgi:hypothetical protein